MRNFAILGAVLATSVLVGCESTGGGAGGAKMTTAAAAPAKNDGYFEARKGGATYVFNGVPVMQKWQKDPSSVRMSSAYGDLSKDGSPVYFQNDNYATFAKLQYAYKSQNK